MLYEAIAADEEKEKDIVAIPPKTEKIADIATASLRKKLEAERQQIDEMISKLNDENSKNFNEEEYYRLTKKLKDIAKRLGEVK